MISDNNCNDFSNIIADYNHSSWSQSFPAHLFWFQAQNTHNFGVLSLDGATFHMYLDWFFIWHSTKTFWDIKLLVLTKKIIFRVSLVNWPTVQGLYWFFFVWLKPNSNQNTFWKSILTPKVLNKAPFFQTIISFLLFPNIGTNIRWK